MNNQILKKRPIIISAWICAGKTYMTNKYDNVTELPSGDYKYILTEEKKAVKNKESLKSTVRAINPEWPKNYYDAIIEEEKNGKYDIILIAPCMPFEEMRNYGIDFIMAYPEPSCKEDYMQRARNRGANEEFLKQPNEKIIIKSGEYLEDALIRVGILKK